ncbi:MAG: DNA-binding protein [Acidilobaceae archaeon]
MRSFLVRAPEDTEILEFLRSYAKKHNVVKASIAGIGAFKEATIAYYDIDLQRYIPINIDERVEILSLLGNISLADGDVFPHIHVVLGKRDGSTIGGHLLRGVVFLAELYIQELPGPPLERKPWKYGLKVWDIET